MYIIKNNKVLTFSWGSGSSSSDSTPAENNQGYRSFTSQRMGSLFPSGKSLTIYARFAGFSKKIKEGKKLVLKALFNHDTTDVKYQGDPKVWRPFLDL